MISAILVMLVIYGVASCFAILSCSFQIRCGDRHIDNRYTIKKNIYITKSLTDRIHCERRLASPGIVSPWKGVLIIQRDGQTPFYKRKDNKFTKYLVMKRVGIISVQYYNAG